MECLRVIVNPIVTYGTYLNALTNVASSSISQTYESSTTWSNHGKLSGLSPSTTYYYKASNSNSSEVYSFTTGPDGNNPSPFSFAVVIYMDAMRPLDLSNNSGYGNLLPGERNSVYALKANRDRYDFIWHPGDIAYADDWLKEQLDGYLSSANVTTEGFKVYHATLNEFYEQFAEISAHKSCMVGPGNHEANCDNGGRYDPETGQNYTVNVCVPGQTGFIGCNGHWHCLLKSLEAKKICGTHMTMAKSTLSKPTPRLISVTVSSLLTSVEARAMKTPSLLAHMPINRLIGLTRTWHPLIVARPPGLLSLVTDHGMLA